MTTELLQDKPVERIIVTHMHPDHTGLAGWLCGKPSIPSCGCRATNT
ncbi:MAG: MBL fold metallo-hydrolase [Thiolinea sp.]